MAAPTTTDHPGAIASLRAATHAAHQQLSDELEPSLICATRERYTRFLVALHGFHAAVEERLPPRLFTGEPSAPTRASLIALDLERLGVEHDIDVRMAGLPALHGRGAMLGAAYVVEGSVLGGLVLAKLAGGQLGLGPGNGAGFFAAGAQSVERWKRIKAVLDAELSGVQLREAEGSATLLFSALRAWMGRQGLLGTPVVASRG